MSDASDLGFGWAVEGLIEQGERLWGQARDQALSIAERLDTRTYTADLLAADVTRSAALAAQGWAALAGELLAAAAAIAKPPTDEPAQSAWFPVPVDRPNSLRLAGDLRSVFGDARRDRFPPIHATQVTIEEEPPVGGARQFRLSVRPRGVRGVTYLGEVEVRRDPQSPPIDAVRVDIQIP
jgi:hypothetical protein